MSFVVDAVSTVVDTVVGLASDGLFGLLGLLFPKKHGSSATQNVGRLNKTIDPEAYRKIVFGHTAAAVDLRFWEVWGSGAGSYDEVIALASHRINAVKEFYLENALAIDAAGNVPASYTDSYGLTQGGYNGVLSRTYNLGAYGQSALSVGSGTQWTSACKFDGVAHMCLKWVPNTNQLPNGVPNRYTQVIEGAPVYDPRRDSTVAGGSGSHRINDRTTWDYAAIDANGVPIGRNNALQVLWYLLGWYVPNAQTGELVLTCGRGVDPSDINLASFITAANNCEAAGYYTDGILSTGDAHTDNEDKLTASGLIGQLIDPGGLWSYYANVDDTANIDAYLTDDDITDSAATTWNDFLPMSDQFVQVVGNFNDPSQNSLYQARAYPMVRDATYEANLGVKRRKSIDFDFIQDSLLAQKLARLALNSGQYQGELTASTNYRVMKAQIWSVVQYQSDRFGWTKLFRVKGFTISAKDGVQIVLGEIAPSIWSAGTVIAPAAVSAGTKFDPRMQVAVTGLSAAQYASTASDGTALDGMALSWTMAPASVNRTEIQYRQAGATSWQTHAPVNGDTNVVVMPDMLSATVYNVRARHITNFEVESAWVNLSPDFTAGNTRKVIWATVAGTTNAPASNATVGATTGINLTSGALGTLSDGQVVTAQGTAAAIVGQAAAATDTTIFAGAGGVFDTRSVNSPPSFYYGLGRGVRVEFKSNSTIGSPSTASFGSLTSTTQWADSSGGPVVQDLRAADGHWRRTSTSTSAWSSWYQVYDQGNKPAFGGDVLETAGGTAATLGNFKTGLGTAAAIAGQGALATQSNVNLGTQVTGSLGPTNAAASLVNANITIAENGTLSGAGGGAVTIGGLGYTGALNATYGATTGTNLSSGSLGVLSDGQIVTVIGMAAAISGQGALATKNNVSLASHSVGGAQSFGPGSTTLTLVSKTMTPSGSPSSFLVIAKVAGTILLPNLTDFNANPSAKCAINIASSWVSNLKPPIASTFFNTDEVSGTVYISGTITCVVPSCYTATDLSLSITLAGITSFTCAAGDCILDIIELTS